MSQCKRSEEKRVAEIVSDTNHVRHNHPKPGGDRLVDNDAPRLVPARHQQKRALGKNRWKLSRLNEAPKRDTVLILEQRGQRALTRNNQRPRICDLVSIPSVRRYQLVNPLLGDESSDEQERSRTGIGGATVAERSERANVARIETINDLPIVVPEFPHQDSLTITCNEGRIKVRVEIETPRSNPKNLARRSIPLIVQADNTQAPAPKPASTCTECRHFPPDDEENVRCELPDRCEQTLIGPNPLLWPDDCCASWYNLIERRIGRTVWQVHEQFDLVRINQRLQACDNVPARGLLQIGDPEAAGIRPLDWSTRGTARPWSIILGTTLHCCHKLTPCSAAMTTLTKPLATHS